MYTETGSLHTVADGQVVVLVHVHLSLLAFCTVCAGTFKELCGAAHAKMIDFIKKWGL